MDELICSLLTFEMSINDKYEKRNKGIAFKSHIENDEDRSEEDTNDYLSNSIALLAKKFRKVM